MISLKTVYVYVNITLRRAITNRLKQGSCNPSTVGFILYACNFIVLGLAVSRTVPFASHAVWTFVSGYFTSRCFLGSGVDVCLGNCGKSN